MAFSRIEQKSRKSGSTQETSTRVGTSRFYSGIWCAYWDLILALVVIASFGMAGCGENNMYGNGKPITRNGGGGGSNPTSSAPTTSSASATGYDISYIGVPQYSCSRNWYLSPSGSDSNDGKTTSTPWATLGHADANVQAGDCVNLASGTYGLSNYVTLNHGGNANTPTGFVTYRSSTQGGAHLIMTTLLSNYFPIIMVNPNYLIFDGIEFDGDNNNATGGCVINSGYSPHHIVVENSIAHGCGSGGIGIGGDYLWFVGNLVYNNAGSDHYYEGSGIDIYEATPATSGDPTFVPNAADKALPAHIIVAFNTVHDNRILPSGCPAAGCGTNGGTAHTDGNGIIFDDWQHTQCNNTCTPYTGTGLILGNIVYNSGGAAIMVYESANVTVANNSTYNNYTDTENSGVDRGEIACAPCFNSNFIDNATYAVAGASAPLNANTGYLYGYSSTGVTFTTNIGYPANNGYPGGPGNLFNTDPKFVAGGNFSLKSGSPAIGTGTAEPWLTASPVNMGQWQTSGGSATQVPAVPTGVSATAVSPTEIDLSWTPVSGVTYNVYRSTTSGFTPAVGNQIASSLSVSSYKDRSVAYSTTYYYAVEAVNSAGRSAASAQASATTNAPNPPATPTGVSAVAVSATQIDLSWTPVSGVAYNIYRSTTSGFTPAAGNQIAASLSVGLYADMGLTASTTYYYVVEAVNSAGSTDAAQVSTTTTAASGGATTGPGAGAAGYTLASLGVPQYACLRNWYLDPNGSDSNDGTSPSTAWATFGQADANAQPGDCVNVASGNYTITDMIQLTHGGNANSSTGYVVYRSSTQDGAYLQMTGSLPSWKSLIQFNTNYFILDGLVLDANNTGLTYCAGENPGPVHHVVVENSILKNCGRAAIGHVGPDYTWTVNNLIYNNGATGVGTDAAVDLEAPTPATSGDPTFTPNAADQFLKYHNVVAFNIVHDNAETSGNGYTMGGIEIWDEQHTNGWFTTTPYTEPAIIVGNIIYNNSGQGIVLYEDSNVTVANNSTYNNDTLTVAMSGNQFSWLPTSTNRGEITCDPCTTSTFVNNATDAVVGTSDQTSNNVSYYLGSSSSAVIFTTNIGFPGYGTSGVDPTTTGTGNLLNTDPLFNNPVATPADFSLRSGSPAIGVGTAEPWLTASPVNMGQWQQ